METLPVIDGLVLRRPRILFVDDEPILLEGMRRMMWFRRGEWDGEYAKCAEEAMEILRETPIDAIVSDLDMPGASGIELLNWVRSRPESRFTPFFILTANREVHYRKVGLECGATDYMQKPADFNELTTRLRNALTYKQFQDAMVAERRDLEARLAERTRDLERARRETLFRLAKAAEARDIETGNHIVRVGACARLLAEELGLPARVQHRLLLTAPLHDVGKIGIPDTILRKEGPLTEDERRLMQTHANIGAQILEGDLPGILLALGDEVAGAVDEFSAMAARIALYHHERWDGRGYPNGIGGEEIPIEARIVAVADVYDALRHVRSYKTAFSPERSLQIIEEGSGTHFDPIVVEALKSRLAAIESIMDFMEDSMDSPEPESRSLAPA